VFSSRLPGNLTPNRLAVVESRLRAEGQSIIDLTESNPTRAGFEYPADLMAPLGSSAGLQYDPHPRGLSEARQAVARDYERQGLVVHPDRVVLTTSTSEAYSLLFKLLANAGEEVLVPRPSYPLLEHLAGLDLVRVRPYDLEYHGRWSIDFESVESVLSAGTKAVVVVSPNNPTGSFVARADLDRLTTLCGSCGAAVIVDEVFADYDLEPEGADHAGRARALADSGESAALMFALGGLSKSIGMPQAKLGWIGVGGPDQIAEEALQRLEFICDTYLSVATPVQRALPTLMELGGLVRQQIGARVRRNYERLKSAVDAVPACRLLRSEGGWYGVVQVPSIEPEEELVVRLLSAHRVLAHPGYFFDFPRGSHLVVSLLVEEQLFKEGVALLMHQTLVTQ
jgi:alanine-synthesizing transaminase